MTTSTVQGAGVRAAQPATGPRSASATSGDAFAAVLSRSEPAQRRPADRPEPRPEPAQQRRLDPVQVRRSVLADRPAPVAQRDRHGTDLGVTRPRSAVSTAATSTAATSKAATSTAATSPTAESAGAGETTSDGTVTGGAASDPSTTAPATPGAEAPAGAAALLAQQLAAAEAAAAPAVLVPVAEQPTAEAEGAEQTTAPDAGTAEPAAGAALVADVAPGAGNDTASGPTADGTSPSAPAAALAAAAGTAAGAATAPPVAATAVGTSGLPGTSVGAAGAPGTATTPTAVDAAGTPVAAPTAQGSTGTATDLGQDGSGSARADGVPVAATTAASTSTTTSSSFAQTLAGLTPTAPAERVAVVAQPAPAAGAGAPSLAEQVRGPVMALRHAAPGEHTLTLQVTPDSLGPVQVKAHIGAAGVRIELLGVTDAGRDGLRALLTDLRRDLAGTGMNASLSLAGDGDRPQGGLAGEWGGAQHDGRGPATRPGLRVDPGALTAELPTETARPTAPTTGATGVDVLT